MDKSTLAAAVGSGLATTFASSATTGVAALDAAGADAAPPLLMSAPTCLKMAFRVSSRSSSNEVAAAAADSEVVVVVTGRKVDRETKAPAFPTDKASAANRSFMMANYILLERL